MPVVRVAAWMLSLLVTVAAIGGCSGPAESGSNSRLEVPKRVGGLVTPEWETNVSTELQSPGRLVAFGAGHGVAALIQRDPCQRTIFSLGDSARTVAFTRCSPTGKDEHPPPQPGLATDVVYSAMGGQPWFLEPRSRNVVSEDISAYRRLVTQLPAAGPVATACSTDGRLVAYLDSTNPGNLLFHDLLHPDSSWTTPLPQEFASEAEPHWSEIRFGGSTDGPCVLVAPRLRWFAIVLGDRAVRVGNFHEPIPAPADPPGWLAWRRWFGPPTSEAPPGPIDATGFPRGIAILYQGATPVGGQLVDLYDLSGRYQETMLLPRRAAAIAATPHRLMVLSERDGGWWLTSYLLPATMRGPAVEAEPDIMLPTKPPSR